MRFGVLILVQFPPKMLSNAFSFLLVVATVDVVISLFGEKKAV